MSGSGGVGRDGLTHEGNVGAHEAMRFIVCKRNKRISIAAGTLQAQVIVGAMQALEPPPEDFAVAAVAHNEGVFCVF